MTPPDAPPWAFRLGGLSHRYPNGKPALDRVTAEVPAGGVFAVLGPSGSGKSTLLSLMGLLWDGAGPAGELRYREDGRECDLLGLPAADKAGLRAAAYGFALQSGYLLPHFTCLQNVAMPLALHGWPARARQQWAETLLTEDGVDPRGDLRNEWHHPPRTASPGQRQRFAVLRAVVTDPTVVFADEPSSNLDPGGTDAMFALLRRWRGGKLFDSLRTRFGQNHAAPSAARRWLDEKAAHSRPRTLVLVCHDVQTARREGNHFLLLNRDHAVEARFERSQWNAHAGTLERVLGLEPGAAGRDEE